MNRVSLGFAALALSLCTAAGGAAAQDRVKAGTLVCDVSGGIGLIIASQKGVRCSFNPDFQGARETYVGTISKFGLDIGATSAGQMIWAVFAPSTMTPGVLAGSYTGATAEATAGLGVGANVLVGGSNRTVALQPLSVTGQTGLNLAAGVASLELRSSN
ncbi:MAG TPA: DUF992 domain-containing protein [Pseudolabrys sp.]